MIPTINAHKFVSGGRALMNYIDDIELSYEVVRNCSHSGDCFMDIRECMLLPDVKSQLDKIDPEKLKLELKEYGAWEDAELLNHEDNLMRILWVAACNIGDEILD